MKSQKALFSLALLAAISLNAGQLKVDAQQSISSDKTKLAMSYQIGHPITNGNLSVFLIHGADKVKNKEYLTLPEGIAKKLVVVKETGDVNTLKIDNLSNAVVFIQSGEIVKGGRQDRALQKDMLIQPQAKAVSLPCFCVEQGRWSGRAGEQSHQFGSAANFVVGNDMNLAVKQERDQSKVWSQVQSKQMQLSRSLKKQVVPAASPSSMQLTLEHKDVQSAISTQYKAFSNVVEKETDAIGYAVAINGKISHADVYASGTLFKKLWPGLLKSAVVEAVAQKEDSKAKSIPTESQVKAVLTAAATVKPSPAPRSNYGGLQGATNGTIGPQGADASYVSGVNTAGTVRGSKSSWFFRTTDAKGGVVHENYIGK
jgi:hypothetical protein